MLRLVASVLVLAACGGVPPSAPPAPAPVARPAPRPLPPVTDDDLLDVPLAAAPDAPVELAVSERRPSRVEHLATLRPALARCGARSGGVLGAMLGGCVCDVMCRARFPADEEITTFRFPFLDVDGLAFTIEPDGRVSSCEYTFGGAVLADQRCGELGGAVAE